MPIIIFWLIVVPVTLAFILGFTANLFRTMGSKATAIMATSSSLAVETTTSFSDRNTAEESKS